jgi:hypothetical protein
MEGETMPTSELIDYPGELEKLADTLRVTTDDADMLRSSAHYIRRLRGSISFASTSQPVVTVTQDDPDSDYEARIESGGITRRRFDESVTRALGRLLSEYPEVFGVKLILPKGDQ